MKKEKKQQEKKEISPLVTLKTSAFVLGAVTFTAGSLIFGSGITGGTQANMFLENYGDFGEGMTFVSQYDTFIYLFLAILFFTIFILYIFAKVEGQRHGDDFFDQSRSYAYRNFPSIYIMEALMLLYVLGVIILAISKISLLPFEFNEVTNKSLMYICSVFSLLGGAMASLFYFMNKVRPDRIKRNVDEKGHHFRRLEFDINRVLKYLASPFYSVGMGILAYITFKGAGSFVGIDVLESEGHWFLIFFALGAGYFSDAFLSIFQRIIQKLKQKIDPTEEIAKKVEIIEKSLNGNGKLSA